MEHLTTPMSAMHSRYDVVVVGSGYGGGIAAARLARIGRRVCVLERGRERQPKDYPETLRAAARHVQLRAGRRHVGPSDALFDFRAGKDMSVLVGCALGGTSIINANVAARPDPRIFDDGRWPAELRGHQLGDEWFEAAEEMLGSTRFPDDRPAPAKLVALAASAAGLHHPLVKPKINVTFEAGTNAAGVHQAECTGCGNCVSGCNDGAKNTVLATYLPYAHKKGAHIFTECEVWEVRKRADGAWNVSFRHLGRGRERFDAPSQFVTADVVVLAAGTLGSTEILLRSQRSGLTLSPMLGQRFSGNGDVIGFDYDSNLEANAVGRHDFRPLDPAPGPCITSMIDLRDRPEVDKGLVIQDAVLPGGVAPLLPTGFAVTAALARAHERGTGRWGWVRELVREIPSMVQGPYRGAMRRTQTYLVMSSDDDNGRLALDGDHVRLRWDDVADRPVFRADDKELADAAKAVGGTYVRDPLWTAKKRSLITVHPLGGCVMGDDASEGVVDHRGEVFDPTSGETHKGLYVADGSVIPRPLGVNPLLTISALAERACHLMIRDRHWAPTAPDAPSGVDFRPGLRFTERMAGFLSTRFPRDPDAGFAQGRIDGSTVEFVVTIDAPDVDELVAHPDRPVRLTGTVLAPELSRHRLTVVDGSFTLFDPDKSKVETVMMRYEMTLLSEEDRTFVFRGHKQLSYGSALRAWAGTTTLYAEVLEHGEPIAAGILRITAGDLLRQLSTMRVPRARTIGERARHLRSFLGMFAGTLVRAYGGVLGVGLSFDDARVDPPSRPLDLPEAEIMYCGDGDVWGREQAADSWLRLTRYNRGGDKGPVILAPGFGMSTGAFVTNTIDTNLTEYLVRHGYDVWLLDYRASSYLESARRDFTIDTVATHDWPVAVAKVQAETGGSKVQVFAHCVGSMSFLMAMLSGVDGMDGVQSAICSQVTTHPVMTWFSRFKAEIRTGSILQGFGFRRISPDVDPTTADKVLDVFLRLAPVPRGERCGSRLCHWVFSIYGPTHRHAQLNQATHDALPGMFGVADMKALNHIARIARKGHAVDNEGREVYLTHPERLRIPIMFLAGAHNRIFLPDTSRRTYEWLRDENGRARYTRHVFPDYAHLDGIIGKRAVDDVYPLILAHLDAHGP